MWQLIIVIPRSEGIKISNKITRSSCDKFIQKKLTAMFRMINYSSIQKKEDYLF